MSCFFSCVLFFNTKHSHVILEVFTGDHVNKIRSAEHSLRKIFFLKKQRKVLFCLIFVLIYFKLSLWISHSSHPAFRVPYLHVRYHQFRFLFIHFQNGYLSCHKLIIFTKSKLLWKKVFFQIDFIFHSKSRKCANVCNSRNLIKKIISSKKSDF